MTMRQEISLVEHYKVIPYLFGAMEQTYLLSKSGMHIKDLKKILIASLFIMSGHDLYFGSGDNKNSHYVMVMDVTADSNTSVT